MAFKGKQDRRLYQFKISPWGLVALGVATFGIFLGMFVLGVWVERNLVADFGKEVAQNEPELEKQEPLPPVPTVKDEMVIGEEINLEGQSGQDPGEASNVPGDKEAITAEQIKPSPKVFFTLQVASLRDPGEAEEVKAVWEKKGYEVFIARTEIPQAGVWYRVQIGRFNAIGEANIAAKRIVEKEKIKLYITTVSVPASPEAVAKD